ncbi:unnamed protein product [Effrenium voratum]|nr:unnamed protein product [Effrenium voratum]
MAGWSRPLCTWQPAFATEVRRRRSTAQAFARTCAGNAVAACADAGALTALLRPRGLAIHLDAQEAALLQQLALEDGEKLVGTASTAMPSGGPSRQNSETRAESLAKMMSAEKLISFDELHFGELLSRGEHTTVQKASYRGSAVVVKALHHQAILYHQDAVEDLLAEIRILSRLSHPRLIPLVGACLESQRLALLTELAPGGNLHHALHVRKVEFSRKQRFELATEFLEGVRYLHSLQPAVLHLDLKSMNLVLDAALQHLRICDFGLSVLSGVRRNLQRGGSPSL